MTFISGMSTNSLNSLLSPVAQEIACADCRRILRQRIDDVVNQWSSVPVRQQYLRSPPFVLLICVAQRTI